MKIAQLLKIKAPMSSIRAKWCMLMIVCVLYDDMTTSPWWRGKVMVYYYELSCTMNKTKLINEPINKERAFINRPL